MDAKRVLQGLLTLGVCALLSSRAFAQSALPVLAPDSPPPKDLDVPPKDGAPARIDETAAASTDDDALTHDSGEPETPEAPKALPEPRVIFGRKGQWVLLGSSNSLGISHEAFSASDYEYTSAGGELGLDHFIADHFSIGCDLQGSYSVTQGYTATSFAKTTASDFDAGVRFGVDVPISALFSWYPRLSLGLSSSHTNYSIVSSYVGAPAATGFAESRVGPWLNLYAPLMLHPAPHFLLGFGPRIEHDFGAQRGGPYAGSQTTLLAAQFSVGGFWGGPPSEPRAHDLADSEDAAPAPAFGDKHQLVLTVATSAGLSTSSYSAADASSTSYALEPSFDYFMADELSLGFDLYFSHSGGNTLDGAGVRTDFDDTSKGIAPRLGVNLAASKLVSIWPRAEIGFGTIDQSSTALALTNQHSRTVIWVELSVPVLFHVASHFFVGAGPYLQHELTDQDQYDFENDATTVGASALLGGWL